MKELSLNKSNRLSVSAFKAVFAIGKSVKSGDLKMIYTVAPSTGVATFAFGIAVGKKSFKHAVKRNRVKRVIREAVRQQMLPLKQQCLLKNVKVDAVILYRSNELPSFESMMQEAEVLLSAVLAKIENTPSYEK